MPPVGGAAPESLAGAAATTGPGGGSNQPRRLKIAYRVRLTSSIRVRANG